MMAKITTGSSFGGALNRVGSLKHSVLHKNVCHKKGIRFCVNY